MASSIAALPLKIGLCGVQSQYFSRISKCFAEFKKLHKVTVADAFQVRHVKDSDDWEFMAETMESVEISDRVSRDGDPQMGCFCGNSSR